MVLCLEVVVAFLIQVSLFHDPVGGKAPSKISRIFFLIFHNPLSVQAHWTDLLGAMCILAAVTGMGFESKVMEKLHRRFL